MTERQVFLHEWVDPENAVRQLERWTKAFDVRAVMLEKVNSTPNDGHVGAFRFGINYGQWQGLLSGLKVPFEMVAPVTWHARLVRKEIAGTPKERSIRTVQLLFPGLKKIVYLKKHHNRADMIMLAYYAKLYGGKNELVNQQGA